MAYILIVDDDEDFATASATVLRQAGHEVDIILDIDSARASMAQRLPDLTVLDVMFPEDSSAGFELARTMHLEDERLKNVPILMLTAINASFPLGFSSEDIDDTWLPVSDFLEKPVEFEVLKQKVAELLQRATAAGPST